MPPRPRPPPRPTPGESPISISSETPTPTPDQLNISLPVAPAPPRRSSSRLRDLDHHNAGESSSGGTAENGGPSARGEGNASTSPSISPEYERPEARAGGNAGAERGEARQREPVVLMPGRERPNAPSVPSVRRAMGLALPTRTPAPAPAAGPSRTVNISGPRGPSVAHPTTTGIPDEGAAPAGSSRATSPGLDGSNEAGLPRRPVGMNVVDLIDLTEEDDDDIEFTGEAMGSNARRAGGRRGSPNSGPLWQDLRNLDNVVAQREAATRAILNDPMLPPVQPFQPRQQDAQYRPREPPIPRYRGRGRVYRPDDFDFDFDDEFALPDFNDPDAGYRRLPQAAAADAAPASRPRIGFGGAVYRAGGRHIQYNAPPAPDQALNRAVRQAQLQDDARDQAAMERMQARVERVGAARRAMDVPNREMVAGIFDGLMQRLPGGVNWDLGRGGREPYGGLAELMGRWAGGDGHGLPGLAGLEGHMAVGDPQHILSEVPMPERMVLPEGYTNDFDIHSNETIEIDQDLKSKKKKTKKFICCVKCGDPLLLSSVQKSPQDKIWALRCSHMLDQKCLEVISSPQANGDRDNISRYPPPGLDVLGAEEANGGGGRGKRQRTSKGRSKKTSLKVVEYEWKCPDVGCGRKHISVLKEAEWKQDEVEGAIQVYV